MKEVLKFVARTLNENGVEWTLIGSLNLKMQGIPDLAPEDIDILIPASWSKKIKEIFINYKIKKTGNLPNGQGFEILFDIKGKDVQFCFENESKLYLDQKAQFGTIIRELNGTKIICLNLKAEKEGYLQTGRYGKAKMIDDYLNR